MVWNSYHVTSSSQHIAHLRQERHNSKFGIFELLVQKETFADALLTGTVSYRSLQNSPLDSSCVVVVLIGNYSTSKPFKSLSWKITRFELWHCCRKWAICWSVHPWQCTANSHHFRKFMTRCQHLNWRNLSRNFWYTVVICCNSLEPKLFLSTVQFLT